MRRIAFLVRSDAARAAAADREPRPEREGQHDRDLQAPPRPRERRGERRGERRADGGVGESAGHSVASSSCARRVFERSAMRIRCRSRSEVVIVVVHEPRIRGRLPGGHRGVSAAPLREREEPIVHR